MNIWLVILILVLLFGVGGTGPWFAHSASWGYGPSGVLGLILLIIVILMLLGKI